MNALQHLMGLNQGKLTVQDGIHHHIPCLDDGIHSCEVTVQLQQIRKSGVYSVLQRAIYRRNRENRQMKLFDILFGRAIDRRIAVYQNDLIAKHCEEVQNVYRTMRGWRHDYGLHQIMQRCHLVPLRNIVGIPRDKYDLNRFIVSAEFSSWRRFYPMPPFLSGRFETYCAHDKERSRI